MKSRCEYKLVEKKQQQQNKICTELKKKINIIIQYVSVGV